ncbi:unnamed protein product, partial [Nesidiocoris tenuis]
MNRLPTVAAASAGGPPSHGNPQFTENPFLNVTGPSMKTTETRSRPSTRNCTGSRSRSRRNYGRKLAKYWTGPLHGQRLWTIRTNRLLNGFAARELCTRIDHAAPKVIIAASCGLEPSKIVRIIQEHKVNAMFTAPTALRVIKRADPHLKVPVLNHWWQTETGYPVTAICVGLGIPPHELPKYSTGLPIPGYD